MTIGNERLASLVMFNWGLTRQVGEKRGVELMTESNQGSENEPSFCMNVTLKCFLDLKDTP